jgi:hypothetical protein
MADVYVGSICGIRDRITYEELMVNPRYMDGFTSACFLPHTDLERFPSVAQWLQCAARQADVAGIPCEGRAAP